LAQRGEPGRWELLGEEKVGFGADHDIIRLKNDENFYRNKAYRRLRFVASGGEVKMKTVRLVYLNGQVQDLEFRRTLGPGQEIDVDLGGERSYLRQIEMFYQAQFGVTLGGPGGIRVNQPTVKVLAENVWRERRPEGPPPGAAWLSLGSERFDRRDDRVEYRVGRRDGRLGQLRLQLAHGERIRVTDVTVRFANGETQRIPVNQELNAGEQTPPLDLAGDRRFIERVSVSLQPRQRPGPVELTLLGTETPGGAPVGGGRRDWVPLGEVSVGFRADRDVIRVGQSEEWFRNRGFDKLHFIAENNDVELISVRIVYLNGQAEDYRVERNIQADGNDLVLDLPGGRSYLREIEIVSRKRPGNRGPALVKVLGETGSRWRR